MFESFVARIRANTVASVRDNDALSRVDIQHEYRAGGEITRRLPFA